MRPRRCRWVWKEPNIAYFKPVGIRLADAGVVCLSVDEFEAIRLKDLGKEEQKKAAKKMGISQPTFHRLLEDAHEKIAKALVEGKAIKIEGGSYVSQENIEKIQRLRQKKEVKGMEKIAVSTNTGNLEDAISPIFGRCPKYTIVEIENKEIKSDKTIENTAAQLPGGAGIQAAQNIVSEGVSVVITGNVGPNALPILNGAGIKVFSATGLTVKDAVQAYLDGKLTEFGAPSVAGMSTQTPGMGAGIGAGRGGGRGAGRGRGAGAGRGFGAGPPAECVCPVCGQRAPHQAGTPCRSTACPKCGITMVRG